MIKTVCGWNIFGLQRYKASKLTIHNWIWLISFSIYIYMHNVLDGFRTNKNVNFQSKVDYVENTNIPSLHTSYTFKYVHKSFTRFCICIFLLVIIFRCLVHCCHHFLFFGPFSIGLMLSESTLFGSLKSLGSLKVP